MTDSDEKYAAAQDAARLRREAARRHTDKPNSLAELMQSDDPWVPTVSGEWVDVQNPLPEKIKFADIVHGVARELRYSNQISEHYSVADHCLILSRCVPEDIALLALMHDAAEAYTSDLISPIKRDCPEFKAIERKFEAAIAVAIDLPELLEKNPRLKLWDRNLCAIEMKHFWKVPGDYWQGGPSGCDDYLMMTEQFKLQLRKCTTWQESYNAFFERYAILKCEQTQRERKRGLAGADAELKDKSTGDENVR